MDRKQIMKMFNRKKIRDAAGDASANAIVAAIRFKITDVRPLIAPSD